MADRITRQRFWMREFYCKHCGLHVSVNLKENIAFYQLKEEVQAMAIIGHEIESPSCEGKGLMIDVSTVYII